MKEEFSECKTENRDLLEKNRVLTVWTIKLNSMMREQSLGI